MPDKILMTFEKARQDFMAALTGGLSDPPYFEPSFPSEEVLDFLATVNTPMDDIALKILREEIIAEWFTEDDPSMIFERPVWSQAVLLIREYRRRLGNYADWYCPPCRKTIYTTADTLQCACGADMVRVLPDDLDAAELTADELAAVKRIADKLAAKYRSAIVKAANIQQDGGQRKRRSHEH